MYEPHPPTLEHAPWTVHKFGGACLSSAAGVKQVLGVLAAGAHEPVVAVVSAVEGMTDLLEELGRKAAARDASWHELLRRFRLRHRSLVAELGLDSELLDRWLAELHLLAAQIEQRGQLLALERDHLLAFGERISARIVAAGLRARGLQSAAVDAFDLGLVSDSNHGHARPLADSAGRVQAQIARLYQARQLPVVTGFIAADESGRLTTLGRNGSDLSAASIAAALAARECVFWKTVAGIHSADPRLVEQAPVLPELSFDTASTFARLGARVLHAEALDPLAARGIPARVAHLAHPERAGTMLSSRPSAQAIAAVITRRQVNWIAGDLGGRDQIGLELARLAPEMCLEFSSPEQGWLCSARGAAGESLVKTLESQARVVTGLASIAVHGCGSEARRLEQVLRRGGVETPVAGELAGGAEVTVQIAAVPEGQVAAAARAAYAAYCCPKESATSAG